MSYYCTPADLRLPALALAPWYETEVVYKNLEINACYSAAFRTRTQRVEPAHVTTCVSRDPIAPKDFWILNTKKLQAGHQGHIKAIMLPTRALLKRSVWKGLDPNLPQDSINLQKYAEKLTPNLTGPNLVP